MHAAHIRIRKSPALFPRPHPAFHCLQYVLPATESWVPGLEQGSTQCDSQSCLLMIIMFFAVGHAFHMQLLCALSCAQSAITISQSVSVAVKQRAF